MRLLHISPVSRCVARVFGLWSRLSLCSLRPVAVTGLVSLGLILHSTLLWQDRLRALQGQDRGRCSDLP